MAQIIAEDCSTTADVSSSIFLYKDSSISAKSSCRIEVEDEPSSTVFIEDIAEDDVYYEEDDVFHSPPSLPYSSERKDTVIAAGGRPGHQLDPLAETYKVSIKRVKS